jgi:hypothetical protein
VSSVHTGPAGFFRLTTLGQLSSCCSSFYIQLRLRMGIGKIPETLGRLQDDGRHWPDVLYNVEALSLLKTLDRPCWRSRACIGSVFAWLIYKMSVLTL